MTQQLTLNLRLRDTSTFENYFLGFNVESVAYLINFCAQQDFSAVFLAGHVGSGRSHLLQACCHAVTTSGGSAIYLPLSDDMLMPIMLQDLENIDLVCLDDIEKVLGNKEWEEAIFHLFNKIHAADGKLLFAADQVPQDLNCSLADLKSRLTSAVVFQLHVLNDEQKIAALIMRAKNRGMTLSEETASFILTRSARDMDNLFATLDRLDKVSWDKQRRLTIPFVKTLL
ncbi:MAG: DnaA regulatory inactivator Hda [Gammaproteobacteria bacterium]|nr:DnaA regulatory inactivator Hda [Gammaproteobacteria bacterium]